MFKTKLAVHNKILGHYQPMLPVTAGLFSSGISVPCLTYMLLG